MDEDFKKIYHRNVDLAHECWGNIIQGLYREFPPDTISVEGSCNEIAKESYHTRYEYLKTEMTVELLTNIYHLPHTPLVTSCLERWLEEAMIVEKQYGIRILYLFYWEHRMGNWNAMAKQELDIAQETFSPFNCRELLTTLLGVDVQLRQAPDYLIYRKIIHQLWPQALSEPINPGPLIVSLKDAVRALLKKLKIYDILRNSYRKMVK